VAKINEDIRRRLAEYTKSYPSVLFIPIPKSDPILIFKADTSSFWLIVVSKLEMNEKEEIVRSKDEAVSHFISFWQGKFYIDDLPEIFIRSYGTKILKAFSKQNYDTSLPKGVFDIPLNAVLKEGIFQIDKGQSQTAKDILRRYGLIEENRGKFKTINKDNQDCRQFLINEFKKSEKQKRLPMKHLRKMLGEYVNNKYPNDPLKADDLDFSDAKIRRILKPFKKK
jgi:hypothetical protein